jgi:UDP-N-acetylmuramyl pentapeptide phosphotransferase/UDP-N-acetylglucosamine-1-phosphate transferase
MNLADATTAKSYAKWWYRFFLAWQIVHWFLLLLITAGSAAAASNVAAGLKGMEAVLPLIVAVVGAIYAAFNPSQRAEAYRDAWLVFNRSVLLGKPDEEIVAAYLLGEEIIGRKPPAG